MAEKSGKVLDCVFEDEWINPMSKKTIYYHRISIDNGDIGKVGAMEKNSTRIKKGALIEYTIDENNKIKVLHSSNDAKKFAKNQVLKDGVVVVKSGPKGRRHDEFLGFVWGYAKDLVIAGKSMDDVRKMPEIAQYLYDEVGKMLNQGQSMQENNLGQNETKQKKEFNKESDKQSKKDQKIKPVSDWLFDDDL